jgi:D-beta-D-heptose 7-phosphate kinase/D-beta-D-heptose 1-phosphate adenosyltransferase
VSSLVVVGDALLDRDVEGRVERLCPEAPAPVLDETDRSSRPGGAGLAAALAASDGHDVTLVTALADDDLGRELRGLLYAAGVSVLDLGLAGATPTKVRLRREGSLLLRLDGGGKPGKPGATVGPATCAVRHVLARAEGVLVSDYGRGVASARGVRGLLALAARRVPLVWDPHPRGERPVPWARLASPNRAESERFTGLGNPAAAAKGLVGRWGACAVAVTLGESGALVATATGEPFRVEAPAASGDTCGAGDRFASSALEAFVSGERLESAVRLAVRSASAFVDAGGAGSFAVGSPPQVLAGGLEELVGRVRARGGRVVATGGCFDLLHVGHLALLRGARALGDCLVVLMNSDASVRRLKGAGRPLTPQAERAELLEALNCVDGVVVFDEETPAAALERLRPDIWVKGGDYAAAELPEARLLEQWGGRVEILPYLEGRSTTRVVEEIGLRAVG